MRTRKMYFGVTLACLSVACWANPAQMAESPKNKSGEAGVSTPDEQTQKQHQHKMPPLPNGIISLDIVRKDTRYHLLTGRHDNSKRSVWYRYSDDHGAAWSEPVRVNFEDKSPHMTRGNDARIAVQGDNIVVAATSFDADARHRAGPMMVAYSNDAGKIWKTGKTPADWLDGSHAFFAMGSDKDTLRIVWLDSREEKSVKGSQGMRYAYSTDGGATWSRNETLDDITCACCWNSARSDPQGNLFVLYRDKQPSDMAVGIVDKQHQWQRQNTVGEFNWNFDGCPHIGGGLDLQVDGDTTVIHSIVGTGHPEHMGIHYLRSNDNGKTWQAPMRLGDETALHSDVAVTPNGQVVAVWDMNTEDGLAIFTAKSTDQGKTWSQPKRLSKPGMRASHPRIVAKQAGFLALWTESASGNTQTLAMQAL